MRLLLLIYILYKFHWDQTKDEKKLLMAKVEWIFWGSACKIGFEPPLTRISEFGYRIWVGPLPSNVCTSAIMAKNYFFISIILVYTSLTAIKFVFACVLKRIPQMDDNYNANVITQIIKLLWITIVGSKFWFEKPNTQQVSSHKPIELKHLR